MEEKLNKVKVWTETHKTGGVGYLGWLSLIFITLKLTGYINWSWWYVLAPIWIPAALAFSVFAIVIAAILIWAAFSKKQPGSNGTEDESSIGSYTIVISKDEVPAEESTESKENSPETSIEDTIVKKKRNRHKSRTKENEGEGVATKEPGDIKGDAVTNK